MPSMVYNNVEGQRMIDNGNVVEDVNNVALPNIENSTTTISVAGMVMDVDMPDMVHFNAAEYSIAHNNGRNCNHLADPGKHVQELRVARQRYNTVTGELEHESVKFRLHGLHKGTEKGTIERGNPYGSTDKYSVTRYEEEIDGEIVTIIDAVAGVIRYNGVDYTNTIENLLN